MAGGGSVIDFPSNVGVPVCVLASPPLVREVAPLNGGGVCVMSPCSDGVRHPRIVPVLLVLFCSLFCCVWWVGKRGGVYCPVRCVLSYFCVVYGEREGGVCYEWRGGVGVIVFCSLFVFAVTALLV